jgi:pyruvate,water dikinase
VSSGADSDGATEILTLDRAGEASVARVGGKAHALGEMIEAGIPVPAGVVVTTDVYSAFVKASGLADRIALELARKPAEEYRWEELWDAAHRVRSWFLRARLDDTLREGILDAAGSIPGTAAYAVRSSAPGEDSAQRSFAGVHESVIGATGDDGLIDAIRSVWASLFSDRALLYRAELGLDPRASSMAVVIQRLATSERSGIAFTRDPMGGGHGIVEAVWGLGEGLVSDRVEPDRWRLARDGAILGHEPPATRHEHLVNSAGGPRVEPLDAADRARPPLEDDEVGHVWSMAMRAEETQGAAQDCEWTFDGGRLVLTQARPITSLPDDSRRRYLGLTPSVERLEALRDSIERERLPAMARSAKRLAAIDLQSLSDDELHAQTLAIIDEVGAWRDVYESEFIPFAHGARLFGGLYVSLVRPEDPFEFVRLLLRTPAELDTHRGLLSELGVDYPEPNREPTDRGELEGIYRSRAGEARAEEYALRVLELGRASWRLRDDDNLYLERLERELDRVRTEVERRLADGVSSAPLEHSLASLEDAAAGSLDSNRPQHAAAGPSRTRPRQLIGQPASPGVASGTARLIERRDDLLDLAPEHIVVADALEPDTAAYAARAAGIVERRGGMLVHGAIVAREHGLPCVTGIADATRWIADGEPLTVDGHLGIVVLDDT